MKLEVSAAGVRVHPERELPTGEAVRLMVSKLLPTLDGEPIPYEQVIAVGQRRTPADASKRLKTATRAAAVRMVSKARKLLVDEGFDLVSWAHRGQHWLCLKRLDYSLEATPSARVRIAGHLFARGLSEDEIRAYTGISAVAMSRIVARQNRAETHTIPALSKSQ